MLDKRLGDLFHLLSNEQYQTAQSMALSLNVSSKMIRNLVKELNENLEEYGAQISSKYGAGYKITINNPQVYDGFKSSLNAQNDNRTVPNTSGERIQYLLEYLLNRKDYVKSDDLCENLFISKKTLTSDLKETEKLLHEYNLSLVRKPNYGIKVEGKEFDRRLCIANYIAKVGGLQYVNQNSSLDKSSMNIIAECITTCLREQNFEISDVSFQNLIVHIYISIERVKVNQYVPMQEEYKDQLLELKEYQLAEKIVTLINHQFAVEFPQSEIGYMAIHLAGKKMNSINSGSLAADNLVISQEVSNIVTEMLQGVYEAFKFDFRDDLELRMSLSQHIVPLEIRIQHHMNMKNPLLKDIKERFSLAYAMATQACTVINGHYDKKLKEDEIGYIALAFALALERQRTEVHKKNILLVCSSGKGSAQLLVYKYQEEFGNYINKIITCDVNGIYKIDFSNIDYVFTSVPIPMKIPVPIQEVQYFLEDNDLVAMKKLLVYESAGSVLQYYDKSLFLTHVNCKTKEEVLDYMCHYVIHHKNLPEEFYQSVLKREGLAKTEFGNNVAMPHPYKAMSKETFVCIGILNEPILWGEQLIQVIFLVSIAKIKNNNLQKFYQITSRFLLNKKYIQELIEKRDYGVFEELINKLENESRGK